MYSTAEQVNVVGKAQLRISTMWRIPENSILLHCPGGLGNRLNVIQAGVLLGRAINKRVYFEWTQNDGLGCCYEDLFKPPKEFSICKALITPYIKTDWLRELNTDLNTVILRKILKRLKSEIHLLKVAMHARRHKWVHDGVYAPNFNVTEEKNKYGAEIKMPCERALAQKKRILVYSHVRFYPFDPNVRPEPFDYVEPTAELQSRIDAITKQFTDKTVGVHIRRGDVTPTRNKSRHVPDEMFIKRMEAEIEEDQDRNFYLATNSHETRETFKSYFGERIMHQLEPSYDRGGKGVKCAVVDLFSLAKTTRIIRGVSSFSGIAGAMSRIKSTLIETSGAIRE